MRPSGNRAYDFDGDERWKKYVMNLEIPPGRDNTAVIERFKAKWYKREIVRTSFPGAGHPVQYSNVSQLTT